MGEAVKEKSEPAPCLACGNPTWSSSGYCTRCRSEGEPPAPAPPPVAPPPKTEPALKVRLDETGLIAQDVGCRGCGYNLRGLGIEATCPECSIPIRRSVYGDLLRFCDPAWVARLGRGVWWIIAGIVATVVLSLAVPIFVTLLLSARTAVAMPTIMSFIGVVALLTSLVMVIGVWFLTSPDPAQMEPEPTITARRLARWCILAQLLASPLQMVAAPVAGTLPTGGMTLLRSVSMLSGMGLGMVAMVGYIAGLVYLRRLALRMERKQLAGQTRVVMWGYLCANGLGLVYSVVFLALIPIMAAGATPGPGLMSLVLAGGCVVVPAYLIFGIWGTVLLFIYAFGLREVATEAKATLAPLATSR